MAEGRPLFRCDPGSGGRTRLPASSRFAARAQRFKPHHDDRAAQPRDPRASAPLSLDHRKAHEYRREKPQLRWIFRGLRLRFHRHLVGAARIVATAVESAVSPRDRRPQDHLPAAVRADERALRCCGADHGTRRRRSRRSDRPVDSGADLGTRVIAERESDQRKLCAGKGGVLHGITLGRATSRVRRVVQLHPDDRAQRSRLTQEEVHVFAIDAVPIGDVLRRRKEDVPQIDLRENDEAIPRRVLQASVEGEFCPRQEVSTHVIRARVRARCRPRCTASEER